MKDDDNVAESPIVIVPAKHAGGRPFKFKNARVLQRAANKYFDDVPITEWTITGLALALDTNRHTLINMTSNDEFFHTVKQIKAKIEYAYELRGIKVGNAFDIFRLKNMGWVDRTEVMGTNLSATVEVDPSTMADFAKYLSAQDL